MPAHLPSLAALRIFEAAGRHLSFTRAASELNITQSAVSRQVRTLEDQLGRRLFERSAQRVTLTRAGKAYLGEIRVTLIRLQEATLRFMAGQGGGMLRIATPPAFGMRWLIPRLPRFHHANPDVIVSLVTRVDVFDLAAEGVDAAIHFGDNDWPGATVIQLLGEQMVVVAAAAYLGGRGQVQAPRDVTRCVLLQHLRRPEAWWEWGAMHGIVDQRLRTGPRFEHYYMIIQAAMAGLGIGLVPRTLASEELAAGRLVGLFGAGVQSRESYCLVFAPGATEDGKLRRFQDWLIAEAEATRPAANELRS